MELPTANYAAVRMLELPKISRLRRLNRKTVRLKWWIGRSAGDVKQMRLCRQILASSKGLLDPPVITATPLSGRGTLCRLFRANRTALFWPDRDPKVSPVRQTTRGAPDRCTDSTR